MNPGNVAVRPWGPIEWILSKIPRGKWSVVGCLSPEERSVAVLELVRKRGIQGHSVLLRIAPITARYASEYTDRVRQRVDKLQQIGYPMTGVQALELFATDGEIVQFVDQFTSACDPDVIIDLSCFPKRFFFPIIKRLLASSRIETLIATYAIPEQYLSDTLAEDHLPFAHLPLFGPTGFPVKKVDMVIVSAGFMKLGLADLLEPYKSTVAIRAMLPFPPGLPAYHRNWEFIREMGKTLPAPLHSPIRVEAYDCADAFEHILQLTAKGTQNTIFAPYGPKPISLAMCLFAILAKSVVYYTQPTVYNPDYSTGIKSWNGSLGGYGYALRINGRNVYSLA